MINLKNQFLSYFKEVVNDDSFGIVRIKGILINFSPEDLSERFVGFHHSDYKE